MSSLGFGIERLGLVPIKYPWQTLVLLAAFTIFCFFGLFHLKPEGKLSEIYRGSSANYADYEKISSAFPSGELDVLVLLSGRDLLSGTRLDDLRRIEKKAAQARGVDAVISLHSLRGEPDRSGKTSPLIPDDFSSLSEERRKNIIKALEDHPDVYGNMLSRPDKNGEQTALIIVTLKEESIREGVLYGVLEDLKKDIASLPEAANFKIDYSGIPVIQQEIRNSINHDTVVFNIGGFLLGAIIGFVFIRRLSLILMVSVAALLANVWVLGILGHFGYTLNAFMTIVPPLIMVIAVSDGQHLILAILAGLHDGKSTPQAVHDSVLEVGPACVLTSLTTTVALFSMAITDSAVIRTFGITAGLGTMAAFIAVILVIPMMSILRIRDESKYRKDAEKGQNWNELEKIEKLSGAFARWVLAHWPGINIVCFAMLAVFAWMHWQLAPKYRLSDEIPNVPGLNAAMDLVDERLGGGQYIHILIRYDKGMTITSPKVLDAIGEAHRLLDAIPEVSGVSSLEETRKWFREHGIENREYLRKYIDKMPPYLRRRLVNYQQRAAIVNGKIAEMPASRLAALVKRLKANLANMKEEYPGLDFTISGLSTVSALQSSSIISQLNRSLLSAMVVVVILIGLAFRSLTTALVAIPPNLFPIVAAGAVLYLTGSGLQFASILGLTVAFGLAVDDTIHFFNRYHLESNQHLLGPPSDPGKHARPISELLSANAIKDQPTQLLDDLKSPDDLKPYDKASRLFALGRQVSEGPDEIESLENTIRHIGPVLILTTLILICGLAVTMLSSLSVTRLFGQLSMATLWAALLADLFFLPSIILGLIKISHAIHFIKAAAIPGRRE